MWRLATGLDNAGIEPNFQQRPSVNNINLTKVYVKSIIKVKKEILFNLSRVYVYNFLKDGPNDIFGTRRCGQASGIGKELIQTERLGESAEIKSTRKLGTGLSHAINSFGRILIVVKILVSDVNDTYVQVFDKTCDSKERSSGYCLSRIRKTFQNGSEMPTESSSGYIYKNEFKSLIQFRIIA